jgi:hypothetical protein
MSSSDEFMDEDIIFPIDTVVVYWIQNVFLQALQKLRAYRKRPFRVHPLVLGLKQKGHKPRVINARYVSPLYSTSKMPPIEIDNINLPIIHNSISGLLQTGSSNDKHRNNVAANRYVNFSHFSVDVVCL